MSKLFDQHGFTTFGPSYLDTAIPAPDLYRVAGSRTTQLRAHVRQECPRCPGVYGMVDAHGELIYVGKAKNLRTRLLSYFRPRGRDRKATKIIRTAKLLCWEYVPSEFAALVRELELIRRWRPAFNVKGQPRRYQRTFVCLGRRPAPYVYLSRRPAAGVLGVWGPVYSGEQARAAVRRLNDWFGLRDCPQAQEMVFADQAELFPQERTAGCLRYELGTCLGPCAALCSRAAYRERVRGARAFLEGSDLTPLRRLEQEMQAAASALAFERAAALREKLTALTWLHQQLDRVRQAHARLHFVYPVAGKNGHDRWYLIQHGFVAATVPVPRDAAGWQQATAALDAVYGQNACGRPTEMDGVLLVAAWFRRYPAELQRVLPVEQALQLCQGQGGRLTAPSPCRPR